ncbi:carbohydrate kinase [Prochlorococcus sp. AH-716-E17]|nr:carbohydrate kinase [Prochlorococcus sp. AH-716-E17]
MEKTKVVCIGEALIDRIKNKSNQQFTDFLGGAPANVACALKKLQIDSAFIGRIGSDEFGKKFINQFKELEVNINFLQLDDCLPTRIVKVNRDKSGDRYFSGFDTSLNTFFADEALNKNEIKKDLKSLEKLFSKTKYFVCGTIILSSKTSADSINFLLSLANKFDVKIIIDLNWREVFWDFATSSSEITKNKRIDLIMNLLNEAHILKLAKEEAILFFENENPLAISETLLNRPDVIITDGANPILWFINGVQGMTEVLKSPKIIDTTGAGDAFLAGLISQLLSFDYPSNESEIQNCVRFASVCGLLTCLGEGAIEQQPDYSKVNKFFGSKIL